MNRRRLQAAAAALATWPLWAATPARAQPVAPGDRVAWPAVRLIDGQTWPAPAGAAVVVFFSITCPFCRRHNAHVEKLRRNLAGRGPALLGVARDRDVSLVKRYMQDNALGFPVTMDHAALAAMLATRNVIPLTVTIDRHGRMRQAIPGEMFEDDVLELAALAGN